MTEFKAKIVEIEEFDNIKVKAFLGYDEMQEIVKSSLTIEDPIERQKNIDMLVLHYAAGFPIETLENTDPDLFLQSGLVSKVMYRVENLDDIYRAIEHEESMPKQINSLGKLFMEAVNQATEQLKEGKG